MIDEGIIKYESRWERSEPLDIADIDDLIRWRKPLHDAGLVGHLAEEGVGYGNLSMRTTGEGLFLVSGTQTGHLPDVGPEHFSLVTAYDIASNTLSCRGPVAASSEALTHAAIYALDASIRAVVHVHSAELWVGLEASLPATGTDVAYGTPEMAMEFRRLFRNTEFSVGGVARMSGHENGLISTGRTVREAAEKILALSG
jgi:ribulose-5-phosphate 4-epimerase/fuculose-1-phosphate aldolase